MTSLLDSPWITNSLTLSEDGIWFSKYASSVAYPESGNAHCLEIEENSYWFKHRNDCILTSIRHFPPAGRIFDVGGGNGYVASDIQKAGLPVAVLEPGIEGSKNARKRGIETVICSTIQDANFPEGSLAAIGLFDVIEHIEKDRDFFQLLNKLLNLNGRLYLTTPAYQCLWSWEDEYAQHYRRYTIGGLSAKLLDAGFTVDFATYIFAFLPLPILIFRTLLGRFRKEQQISIEAEKEAHRIPRGVTGMFIRKSLEMEVRWLSQKRRIPGGGSCLLVARKVRS